MGKQIQRWQITFAVCLSQVVVQLFGSNKAIDAAHARAGMTFRVIVILVFALLAAFAGWKMKVLKAQKPLLFTDATAADPHETEAVTTMHYRTDRADSWRNELHSLRHRPASVLTLLLMGLAGAFLVETTVWAHRPLREQVLLFPVALAFSLLCWAALFGALIRMAVNARLPQPDSVRECVVSLTPQGFQDVTPDNTFLYSWREVTAVRNFAGDIHVWSGWFSGCYIPRTAFSTPEEGRAFYHRAVALWRQSRAASATVQNPLGA